MIALLIGTGAVVIIGAGLILLRTRLAAITRDEVRRDEMQAALIAAEQCANEEPPTRATSGNGADSERA